MQNTNISLVERETNLEMGVYKKRDIALSHGVGSTVFDVEGKNTSILLVELELQYLATITQN